MGGERDEKIEPYCEILSTLMLESAHHLLQETCL